MAKIRGTLLRKLHSQMGAILDEFETNCAEERAAGGKDKVLDLAGPDTDVISPPDEHQGAMDSRGERTLSMREAFWHVDER